MTQVNFFDAQGQGQPQPQAIGSYTPPQPGQPQVVNSSPNGAAKRVFFYNDRFFQDPGPEYTVQDVLVALAGSYPELANGTWHTQILPDGTEQISFAKVSGEKGAEINAGLISTRLFAGTNPATVMATKVLQQLAELDQSGQLTPVKLLTLAPQIESAIYQGEQLAQVNTRILKQCLYLKPISHPQIPLGF